MKCQEAKKRWQGRRREGKRKIKGEGCGGEAEGKSEGETDEGG